MEFKIGGYMARYGKKAQELVAEKMHEYKEGVQGAAAHGRKITSKKQAIAIGLSEARKEGAKVPSVPKKSSTKK